MNCSKYSQEYIRHNMFYVNISKREVNLEFMRLLMYMDEKSI